MNVFVLTTGRSGSVTFSMACRHITNFTSSHESRTALLGAARFGYPDRHIEVDNRLSWLLGRLDAHYGDGAFYVHLRRCAADTAASFAGRIGRGIMGAYGGSGILMGLPRGSNPAEVAADYCATVDANVALFLRDKTRKMDFALESAKVQFPRFWESIGARGDLGGALSEFDVRHNAS